jgi:hypothetical protein
MAAAAALPLLPALLFKMHWLIELLLCLLSSSISCLELITPAKKALAEKRFKDPLLLMLLAGALSFIAGAFASAALALIVYRLAVALVGGRTEKMKKMADTRLELTSLKKYAAPLEDKPRLDLKLYAALDKYLPPVFPALAVLYAVLAPLLGAAGVLEAVKRAAVILAVAGFFSVFAPFPFIDYAVCIRALECGILFKPGALGRLAKARLLHIRQAEPEEIGGIKISVSDSSVLTAKSVLFLAATAFAYSGGETALRLAEAYGKPIDRSAVSEAQELEGLGVIAKIRGTAVCVGNAIFMNRAGLPVMPFAERGTVIHVGVNGRYAGKLDFDGGDMPYDEFKREAEKLGLYVSSDAADISEKRTEDDLAAFASDADFPEAAMKEGDVRISSGGFREEADICAASGARAELLSAFGLSRSAEQMKKGCLAVFLRGKGADACACAVGLMPLWGAIATDAAAALLAWAARCGRWTLKPLD